MRARYHIYARLLLHKKALSYDITGTTSLIISARGPGGRSSISPSNFDPYGLVLFSINSRGGNPCTDD